MSDEGERFARALAAQDSLALKGVLAEHVDFAALTPGRNWASGDAAEVVDDIVLGPWFGPGRSVELVSVATEQVADCRCVAYRLRVRKDGADHLVEQHAFYTARDDRIDWMRLVCSGYRPAEVAVGP